MPIIARDTDHLKLTRKLRARLNEQSLGEDECLIFHRDSPRRHIEAETYEPGCPTSVVSVSRLAYAFAHERCGRGGGACVHGDPNCIGHLLETDQVNHLCSRTGNSHTGEGACLNPAHLRRGTQETGQELRKARASFAAVGASPCFT